jgi:uncharacterized damage-inducible protein DinB
MTRASASYVRGILVRELGALRREILAYPTEADIWTVPSGVANSAGTLSLHICGNLRHFVGARLGGSGYVRDRPGEFSRRDVPREELIAALDRAIAEIGDALGGMTGEDFAADYPDTVAGVTVTTGDFLLHLVAHTAYHLGQVDYHRRIVTGSAETVGAVPIPELGSARPA